MFGHSTRIHIDVNVMSYFLRSIAGDARSNRSIATARARDRECATRGTTTTAIAPHMSELESQSCFTRTSYAAGTSAAFGALVGTARAAWGADAPAVVRARAWPALAKTAGALASGAALFGAIGALYASTSCAAEHARGEKDAWNGAIGGACAGQVLGLRNGSARSGLSAGAAFALVSMAYDMTGRSISTAKGFDDNATPARIVVPYR